MSSLLTRTSSEGATGTLVPLRRLDDLDEKAVFLPIRPAPGLVPGAAFIPSGRCRARANAMHPSRTRTYDIPKRDRRRGQPFRGSGETTAEGLSVRPYHPAAASPARRDHHTNGRRADGGDQLARRSEGGDPAPVRGRGPAEPAAFPARFSLGTERIAMGSASAKS